MNLAQEIKPNHVEQLKQLLAGPVWDGNLIDKSARDWLFNRNCIHRCNGFNFVVTEGIKLACLFNLLKK